MLSHGGGPTHSCIDHSSSALAPPPPALAAALDRASSSCACASMAWSTRRSPATTTLAHHPCAGERHTRTHTHSTHSTAHTAHAHSTGQAARPSGIIPQVCRYDGRHRGWLSRGLQRTGGQAMGAALLPKLPQIYARSERPRPQRQRQRQRPPPGGKGEAGRGVHTPAHPEGPHRLLFAPPDRVLIQPGQLALQPRPAKPHRPQLRQVAEGIRIRIRHRCCLAP
jgi:hypothetical protein